MIKRQLFKTEIDASREKIWDNLWGTKTYPKWTKVFNESSQVKTDWKEGGKALFHDGSGNGMVSVIEKSDPPKFMSFKHIGILKDGQEITEGEEVKKWAPAYENYTLKTTNGKTELLVEMDMNSEYEHYFKETWPKALKEIKELSEGS